MKKKSKQMSTYEREMRNPKFRASFEQEYQEFALQELLLSMSQGDEKSVRNLAKQAGLHPNAIQNLRSGKTDDIKLTSFLKIARAYGFSLQLVKGKKRIPVTSKTIKAELTPPLHNNVTLMRSTPGYLLQGSRSDEDRPEQESMPVTVAVRQPPSIASDLF
jgi:hypothetical protein